MGTARESLGRVAVVVELHPCLERFLSAHHDARLFLARLERYLDDLREDLRLPTDVDLTVVPCKEVERFPVNRTLYQVMIGGRPCRLGLQTRTAETMSAAQLAQAVAKDISGNRALIFTPALSETIRQRWLSEKDGSCFRVMSAEEFHELLSLLVQRGARVDRARELDRDKDMGGWSVQRKCEVIVASPTATAIQVYLGKTDYDRWLRTEPTSQPTSHARSFRELLDRLDDAIFDDLGLILPAITVGVDENLEETEFRLQLNDLRLPPMGGLSQDQLLVDATAEELRGIAINSLQSINPATGAPCAIVQGNEAILEKCRRAFSTHGPTEFIGLCLSGELRRNAGHLLTTTAVECSLDLLEDSSPALVHATLQRFDVLTLTWIMRELLREEVSVRNLRALLESLLSVRKPQPVDVSYYASWVRADFKRYLSYKYSRDRNTLFVYRLAPQIEGRIAESDRDPLTEDERYRLLQSLFHVVEELSATACPPVLLTSWEARRKLRHLVDRELPSLVVLAYQELSADVNIQPLGRIEFTTPPAH